MIGQNVCLWRLHGGSNYTSAACPIHRFVVDASWCSPPSPSLSLSLSLSLFFVFTDQPPDRRSRAHDGRHGRSSHSRCFHGSRNRVRWNRHRLTSDELGPATGSLPCQQRRPRKSPSPSAPRWAEASRVHTAAPRFTSLRRATPLRAALLFPRAHRALRLTSNKPGAATRTHSRAHARTHRRPVLAPHASTPREASVVVAAPRGIPFFLSRAPTRRRTPLGERHLGCTTVVALPLHRLRLPPLPPNERAAHVLASRRVHSREYRRHRRSTGCVLSRTGRSTDTRAINFSQAIQSYMIGIEIWSNVDSWEWFI